jgi:hypothetical protein
LRKTAVRKRFTLSLRVFMILVLAGSAGLGWLIQKARRQRLAVAAIEANGGDVLYDWQDSFGNGQRWAPAWLRSAVGAEHFQEVKRVHISLFSAGDDTGSPNGFLVSADRLVEFCRAFPRLQRLSVAREGATDRALKVVGGLGELEYFRIWRGQFGDAGLEHLTRLPCLRTLVLEDTRLSDNALRRLDSLTHLETLEFAGCLMTNHDMSILPVLHNVKSLTIYENKEALLTEQGFVHFSRLPKLEDLSLTGCNVTDDGLNHLKCLNSLKDIYISGARVKITSAGFQHLRSMKFLKTLTIKECQVRVEDVRQLESAIPRVRVQINQ